MEKSKELFIVNAINPYNWELEHEGDRFDNLKDAENYFYEFIDEAKEAWRTAKNCGLNGTIPNDWRCVLNYEVYDEEIEDYDYIETLMEFTINGELTYKYEELTKKTNCKYIEFYKSDATSLIQNLHTDNCQEIHVDSIEFLDYELVDVEEVNCEDYNNTLYANCDNNTYNEDDSFTAETPYSLIFLVKSMEIEDNLDTYSEYN